MTRLARIVRINRQNPDIVAGVHVGKDEMIGAGDQGIMFGYASDKMPLTHSTATTLGRNSLVRDDGKWWWLRPDGKTQVTIEYGEKANGSAEPRKMHTMRSH